MKNFEFRLSKWTAAMLVIAAVFCLFPNPSVERVGQQEVTSPSSTATHVPLGDHERPREIAIEGLLDVGDPKRFDLDIAALLNREEERRTTNDHFGSYQQIASTIRPGTGGGNE